MFNFINIMAMSKIQEQHSQGMGSSGAENIEEEKTLNTVGLLKQLMSPSEFKNISMQIDAMDTLDENRSTGKRFDICG